MEMNFIAAVQERMHTCTLFGDFFSGFFAFAFIYGLISSTSILTGNAIGILETKLNLISPVLIVLGIGGFLFVRKYKQ